jgi:subtilase family serine protease
MDMPQSVPVPSSLLSYNFLALIGKSTLVLLTLALLALWPPSQAHGQTATSFAPVPDRIVDRVDDANMATIQGSTHPAVRNAIDNGRLPSVTPMSDLVLVLHRSAEQQAALDSFNEAQNDPSSPEYHHWLTPQEFGAAYGVSQNDLNAVSSWLQSHGFSIQEISPAGTSIRFSGNSEQVETAFHTEMHSVQSNGVAHIANTSDIQIPAALTPVVTGVKALHNFFPKAQHHTSPMLNRNSSGTLTSVSGTSSLPALSQPGSQGVGAINLNGLASAKPEYTDSGYQLLVPYDMATIYNYKSLWTASAPINGTGQTIALAGTSNIVLSDVATFRAATGLPANVPKVIITNSDPGTTALLDDRFENTLDVEWSGAVAPGASIVLVTSSQTSQTTDALYASESYIINNNVAKIMSVSYGECELGMGTAGNQEYLNLWQQAYSQGIAVFVSSGDSAAAVCDDGNYNPAADYAAQYGTTVSGMTSTPYNVSVGGTDFNSAASSWSGTNSTTNMSNATGYIPEVPWNDTVTNQFVISSFNSQLGVNYSAEQWANYLLKNDGISSGLYDELIPPVGGSGGVSNCTTSSNYSPSSCGGGYPKPSWQAGVTGIVSTDKRTVPDVSFFASAGFMGVAYLICDTQPPGYTSPIPCTYPANALDMAVGGTSVSSPVMAGVMALINQKAGSTQGNPNAVLYGLAAKQTYSSCSAETATTSGSCLFNDIDTGTIATPCFAGSVNCTAQTAGDVLGILPGYAATAGYDKATGLGSLNVANVVNGWPSSTPGPQATLAPTNLTFTTTNVGASSATQTVSLSNPGTTALTISGITISGANATAFSETNNCGTSLAASASCIVTVTFKPAATGALSATLNFADNVSGSPQKAALSGTGFSGPAASLSTASLAFASTNLNVSSAPLTVTLSNPGTAVLTLSGITVSGANASSFSQTNTCGASLAVSASCTVTVTFKPTVAGALMATLNFADNAANSAQTVALSGTGTVPSTISVSVSPSSLTFPSTNVGASSAMQVVTFTNTGTASVSLTSSPTLTGTYATLFHGASSCGGNATLAPGASCLSDYTFVPTAAGTFSATLTFNDTAPNSPQTLTLSGTGANGPAASFSPTSLTFASTNVGVSSATQSFTLTNTGNAALALTSIITGGANPSSFIQNNNCGTISAGGSCTVTVTFKPTATGALSATLSFADNAANTPQTVALSGTGATPTISLSTASLAFASTAVGASSATQNVTLTNTGTAAVVLSGIAIIGTNATSFTDTTTCGASLAASSSCIVSVTFKPSANGSLSASLSFADNAANSPQAVALSGTGTAPTVTLSAANLTFAATNTGASAAAQTVTLTNTGTAALTLSGIIITGTNATSFTDTTTCGASLAISASCTVSVTFKPSAAGALSASLSFADNATNSPQAVTLSGTGNAPAVSLSPTSLAFASTIVSSSSATQGITLKNTGTAALTLSGITIGGSNATSFSQTNNCGTSLAASASCTVTVTFKPAAGGALTASLGVADNATGSPQSVTLSGSGVVPAPIVTLSVASLSFPVTAVSAVNNVSYSPAQAITLTNTGNAALSISSIALGGTTPKSFAQINNCPATLAVAAGCTALVRFSPTASGSLSATLVFSDNASPTTQSIALSGTGAAAPAISLSSTTLSFGSVTHATVSVAQAITLTNTSTTTPLNLTSIALSGTGAASYVQVNNCGTLLAPNSSCIVLVQFAPTATGSATASLTITANNPTATATVVLSGTGQ